MDRSAELAGSCNLPVLDACLPLLVERRSTVARIGTAGPRTCPDAEVLAVGIDRIRRVLPRLLADSHQVVSVSAASAESLAMAEEPNRRLAEAGVWMRARYDAERSDPETADLLLDQPFLHPAWASAPVEMKILDRRLVLLEGPRIHGERSVLGLTGPRVMAAAWRYWRAVDSRSVPLDAAREDDPLAGMSPRQREIAHLLADGESDERIGRRLDVSVRTVRYDVARLMRLLGTRSRFGLGLALGRLGFAHLTGARRDRPRTRSGEG